MSIFYTITDTAVWVKAHGKTSYDEITEAIDKAIAHPRFVEGLCLVIDLQELTRSPTTADLKNRARHLAELSDRLARCIAIIVDNDRGYEIGERFKVQADQAGFKVQVFRQQKAATDWLALNQTKPLIG